MSLGLCPSFRILKKIKIADFTAIFLPIFDLDFRRYKHIHRSCSEMAGWILLKLYSSMPCYPEMIHMFSDLNKIKNWQFYDRFSEKILPDCKIVKLCSETTLRNGSMDSFEILRQYDLYSREGVAFLDFEKVKSADFKAIFMTNICLILTWYRYTLRQY